MLVSDQAMANSRVTPVDVILPIASYNEADRTIRAREPKTIGGRHEPDYRGDAPLSRW